MGRAVVGAWEDRDVLRTIIAAVVGLVVGGCVNMGLISVSPWVVAPPAGVDMTTAEGLQTGMALLEPRHFLMPWLAHALVTLVGAFVAARIAARHRLPVALVVGVVFLAGGIAAATMIPAPRWFIALDLIAAYLPMAWLAHALATRAGN